MKTASVSEVKARLGAYLKDCVHGPIVVTERGRPVALLVSMHDNDVREAGTSSPPRLRDILAAARRQIREGKTLSHEEFWRKMAQDKPAARPRKAKRLA
jgi:prevent-host-death family protein